MKEINFTVTDVAFAYARHYDKGHIFVANKRPKHGLTLITSGEFEMTVDKKKLSASQGSIIMQRKNDSYKLTAVSDSGVDYVVISYDVEPEAEIFSLIPDKIFFAEHIGRYTHAFESAARLFASNGICNKTLLRTIVQEILCNIIDDSYSTLLYSQRNPVEYAKSYIEQYFNCPLSVDNIASVVGLSPSYLRTLFKKSEGESPNHYLNRTRIEHAKEMLLSEMFTIEEVASACGFQNVYYFSRVFKKYTGIPPGKY